MTDSFTTASWIARPVPAARRVMRQISATRVDWAEPGRTIGQTFDAEGPIVSVGFDLTGPRDADPHAADVRYTVSLMTSSGEQVAGRTVEGPQLLWDYFGVLLEVEPAAPPGRYVALLHAEREAIGWSTAETVEHPVDDGVSPLPVLGTATVDGAPVQGVRLIGIDTLPAANPVFRRRFELVGSPASATLAASVLGAGIITVNGSRVGEEMLEPAVTDYDRAVEYRQWDVAHLLRAGENEIRVEAGRERYAVRGGDVWGWNLAPWHREPVALLELEIDDVHGTRSVVTDGDWEASIGQVETERFFRGEDHVIRAEEPEWAPATVVDPPSGRLRVATGAPVLAGAPRPAVVVEPIGENRTVYDFGSVMVGRIRCTITGSTGASVRVVSGEQRSPSGEVVCDNFLVAGEAQLDTVRIERSVTDLTWEPKFGYRGFRWMQVETAGDVVVEDVRAVPLTADVRTMGELSTDEPVIEWIDGAMARTFRNNLHGIPTDTPIYEKNGWTADAHLATEALLHHFDLRAAFGKWIDDHIDAQGADGAVPQIIPTPGWGRRNDPSWSSSAVLIPWYLYREYGDRTVLERAAPMIGRFADRLIAELDDGLWRGRTWGDWLSPGHHLPPEGMAPIGTLMSATALQHAAAVFGELGDDLATHFTAAADAVADRYHATYFDDRTRTYAVKGVAYRQALNILPLAFGLVPAEHVRAVQDGLVGDLTRRTDGHLDCGALGVRHLLPVLSAAGRDDLAVTVLTRRTRPGWGAWFSNGEATLLESWDVDARSRNHYFLGSVDAWIQQRVGALRSTQPGWKEFEVAPVDDPRVTRARMSHRTPLGDASVHWQRGSGGWRVEVTVPDGSKAQVRVAGAATALSSGHHVVQLPLER